MRNIIASIEEEYRRYKALAEGAIAQITDADLTAQGPGDSNSIAVILAHLAGNFASRFTDFLTTDGEKPWRDRDREFVPREARRQELLEAWERSWAVLFGALAPLTDDDLLRTVTIRKEALSVHDALHRSLAHTAYHVGQIVYIARASRAGDWRWLSIPPGQSAEYNRRPTREKPQAHAAAVQDRLGDRRS
ncbi:MAG TPA: DUF1572 family protein [Vicinamibacterales bacterium]|nr:DUF1572 family protein [Vicinamibacterales bacterium]